MIPTNEPFMKKAETYISDNDRKLLYITCHLKDAGDARDAVHIIEEQGVDKFDFDYPYGSFEEFKKHTLAGEFDVDIESMLMTDEEIAEQEKAIREGRLRVTY